MGTRADFYAGRGESAEWLGSIAWDGNPEGEPRKLLRVKYLTADDWRAGVAKMLAANDDGTTPEQGWPWPWEDSHLTDYSYAYDDGKVYATHFGYVWWEVTEPEPERSRDAKSTVFPDMRKRQNVTLGPRSGLLVFGVGGPIKDLP